MVAQPPKNNRLIAKALLGRSSVPPLPSSVPQVPKPMQVASNYGLNVLTGDIIQFKSQMDADTATLGLSPIIRVTPDNLYNIPNMKTETFNAFRKLFGK
jgi:hypothetical protein